MASQWAELLRRPFRAIARRTRKSEEHEPDQNRSPHRKADWKLKQKPKWRTTDVSDENFERFKNCAVEVLSVEEADVVPEANFADDLNADSLDIMELVMALEEEFDLNIEEQELDGVATVAQAYELVTSKL